MNRAMHLPFFEEPNGDISANKREPGGEITTDEGEGSGI